MHTIQEKELLYGELIDLLQRNDSVNFLWLDSGQSLFDAVVVPLLNPKIHKLVRELYAAGKITEEDFRNTVEIQNGGARVRSFLEQLVACIGETATKDVVIAYLNLLKDRLKFVNAQRPKADVSSFRLVLMEHYRQCVCYVQLFAWDPATLKQIAECYIPRNFYSVTINQGGNRAYYDRIKYEEVMEYYDTTNRNQTALGGLVTFVSGESGIGKSTLAKQIVFDWVQGKILKTIDLLLYVPLGECTSSFERLIDIAIHYYTKNLDLSSVIDRLKGNEFSSEIMLLFDGLDEFQGNCPELDSIIAMQGEWLNYHLIITSKYRKRDVEYDCQIDLQGITAGDIEEYMQKTLGYLDKTILVSFVKRYREIPFYQELCRLPVLMNHICAVVDLKEGQLPATIAELFDDIYKCFVHRFASDQQKIADVEQHLNVSALGHMAMDGTLEGRYIWSLAMATKYGIDKESMAVKLGFLRSDSVYQPIPDTIIDTVEFIHPIFQDYFAAQYIKDAVKETEFLQKFAEIMTSLDFFRYHPHLLSFAFNTSALATSKITSALIQVLYDIFVEYKNSHASDKYSYMDVCISDISQLCGYVFQNFQASSTKFPSDEYILELPCDVDDFVSLQIECALIHGRSNVYKWHSMLPLLSDYMRQIITFNPYISQIIRMQLSRHVWAQRVVPLESIQTYSFQEKQPENLQKFLLERSVQLLAVSVDVDETEAEVLSNVENKINLTHVEAVIVNGEMESVLYVFDMLKIHFKQINTCVANITRINNIQTNKTFLATLKLFDQVRCLELIFSDDSRPQFDILNADLPPILNNPNLGILILINNSALKPPHEFAAEWIIDWKFDTLQIQNFGHNVFIHALNGIQKTNPKSITKLSLCPVSHRSMGSETVQMDIPVVNCLKSCTNLRLLDLGYFNLPADQLKSLMDSIDAMEQLEHMNLSGNPAVSVEFGKIVDRLLSKPQILILFAHCNLTDDALQIIYEKLLSQRTSNDQIKLQLWLRGNKFTEDAKSSFAIKFRSLDVTIDFE